MDKNQKNKLSKPDKILIFLYELSKKTENKKPSYEDMIVGIFKKYPKDFSLRGYPQYPDSESISKEFYRKIIKSSGLVNYSNRTFSLTDRGIEYVEKIIKTKEQTEQTETKLPRFVEKEINRITSTEGFLFFAQGYKEKITDTDFYNYLGITARTNKNNFLGRIETVIEMIQELKNSNETFPARKELINYHKFLMKKFENTINYFKSK